MREASGARSPLDSVGRPASLAGRDLWLCERPEGTITHLEGPRRGPALTGCLAALGVPDLPVPGSSAASGAGRLLSIGPGIWLLLAEAAPPLREAFDVAVDVTAAWTRIAIGGATAPALMAKGCALDLHPRAFPTDACATAGFAGMRTIIRCAEDGFELLVGRSYALSLWEWLVDAATEYLGEGAAGADRANKREQRQMTIPPKDELTICFAHVAYQLQRQFERRNLGLNSFQVWSSDELDARIGDADVLVISGLWRDELVERGRKLRFIQSVGAGVDQFPKELLAERGIRLASARGVNRRAVSEHAMALILALSRRLPEARDNQARHVWRGMVSDLSQREDELGGKTLIIVGLGGIGGRLAELAKAFDLNVIGFRRDPAAGKGAADSVHDLSTLKSLLPQADFIALTCPLTKETEKLIDADALGRMKRSAFVVNVARGRCVDENALAAALAKGRIAGAAIDVTVEEPLAASSPLWDLSNALVTPHTGGETRRYEDNVLDILQENLDRMWRGDATLRNHVV